MSEFLKKALGMVLTPVFLVVCLGWLCIFHAAQIAALRLGGPRAHRQVVNLLNGFLMGSLVLLGNRPQRIGEVPEVAGRPLIVIANHQSTLDVVGLGWYLSRLLQKKCLKKGLRN